VYFSDLVDISPHPPPPHTPPPLNGVLKSSKAVFSGLTIYLSFGELRIRGLCCFCGCVLVWVFLVVFVLWLFGVVFFFVFFFLCVVFG